MPTIPPAMGPKIKPEAIMGKFSKVNLRNGTPWGISFAIMASITLKDTSMAQKVKDFTLTNKLFFDLFKTKHLLYKHSLAARRRTSYCNSGMQHHNRNRDFRPLGNSPSKRHLTL